MSYKTTIQLLLVIFISLAIFFFSNKYLEKKKIKIVENKKVELEEQTKISDRSNIINEVSYSTADIKGNKYEIYSKTGEVDLENPNLIFMNNVKAKVILQNNEVIFIASDNAKYNSKTHETYFTKNIKLSYIVHEIQCENLNLNIDNNFLTLYEDVVYYSYQGKINADRIEIDLLKKDMKIMMDNEKNDIQVKINKI